MASVVVQKFGGIVPRMSPRLLTNGDATVATMIKLWSGELRPFRELSVVPNVSAPLLKSLYLLLDKWLAWPTDVDVVTGFTTGSGSGRIYFTGYGPPQQTTYDLVRFGPPTPLPATTYPIGVVGPTTPVIVSGPVSPGPDPVVRDYVYTFYTSFNEESVPSPPSALVTVGTGDTVILSGFENASGLISQIRIYRTVGGSFTYVDTIYPSGFVFPSYTDSKTDLDIVGNEALQSQHYYPPPADIKGIIGLACGSLAAFHGNRVVFSEPYQPGAWPPEYEKIFDYPVVALGTFGQTCVVATTGFTYLVSGNDPRSFSVSRIPDPYPCVSKRSMVSADSGVIYASSDGLIFVGSPSYVSSFAGVHVLTRDLMTHDEWQAYNPSTITAGVSDGRYYAFYNTRIIHLPGGPVGAGFILDFSSRLKSIISGAVEENTPTDRKDVLLSIDFFATSIFANPQVSLHVGIYDKLYEWEGGFTYRALTWRSKQYSFPYAVTFSAAKIIFNPDFPQQTTFRILDGVSGDILYERLVTTDAPFRLPPLRGRTEWMFELQGVGAIQLLEISSSYQDLTERKAA